jgi:hypothetical protein
MKVKVKSSVSAPPFRINTEAKEKHAKIKYKQVAFLKVISIYHKMKGNM